MACSRKLEWHAGAQRTLCKSGKGARLMLEMERIFRTAAVRQSSPRRLRAS